MKVKFMKYYAKNNELFILAYNIQEQLLKV